MRTLLGHAAAPALAQEDCSAYVDGEGLINNKCSLYSAQVLQAASNVAHPWPEGHELHARAEIGCE